MYCCLRRELHFLCSRLKETAELACVAEKSFTGMETRPKEMVAVPTEWAAMSVSIGLGASFDRKRTQPSCAGGKERSATAGPPALRAGEGMKPRSECASIPS